MEIAGESLDEVLIEAYGHLQAHGTTNVGTRGGTKEIIGVAIRIQHPRARLSRSADRGLPFSALGELLWYLTGSDDPKFILAYISKYAGEIGPSGKINGAYGPRIFSRYKLNQLDAVADLLKRKRGSRRAVVQIYSAEDLLIDEEVPCTTTLQFFVRDDVLHLAANLRSNDAYVGLPHDVFCFTMLQEMMARRLGVGLGEYIQMIGSFHVYDKDQSRIERYISEGHHRLAEMPAMPAGDPFAIIPNILDLENRIRGRENVDEAVNLLDPYWGDLLRLVEAHFASEDVARMDEIEAALREPTYRTYVQDRRGRRAPKLTGDTPRRE